MVELLTITDTTISSAFVAAQFLAGVVNDECPACLEPVSGKRVRLYRCRAHAVCAACAPRCETCPLCRAPTNCLTPLVVSIEAARRIVEDGVPFDKDAIRGAMRSVGAPARPLTAAQAVALRALSTLLLDAPELAWHDLWRAKQLTRHLNVPGLLPGWDALIRRLTDERTRVIGAVHPAVRHACEVLSLVMP